MRNIRLLVAYDGTNFCGWQVQPNCPTVQKALEDAIKTILHEEVRLRAASRTDAGVHALSQVANFKTENPMALHLLQRGINALIPPQVRVKEVTEVSLDFDARHHAIQKKYRYCILNQRLSEPFLLSYVWHVPRPLDWKKIEEAAHHLQGEHDFSAFTASDSTSLDKVRHLEKVVIQRSPFDGLCEALYFMDFMSRGFLHKMVRNMVGTLIEVGLGKLSPKDVKEILASRQRTLAGPTAPARGLWLWKVEY